MKIGAIAAGITLSALMLLAGCPKSNPMLDHSKTAGAVQQVPSTDTPGGEMTTATPGAGSTAPGAPAGGSAPPPSSGKSSGGDKGGGKKGGDKGGGDDEGGD